MNPEEFYSYCPHCGTKYENKTKEALKCNNCGYNFYMNAAPCTGLIFYSENDHHRIMLVKRAVDPSKGKLDVAGGFLGLEETFEEGLQREIKEELNYEIDKSKLEYLTSFCVRYLFQNVNHHLACNVYIYPIDESIKFETLDDVAGFEFYNINEIKDEDLAFEGLKSVLESYKSKILK